MKEKEVEGSRVDDRDEGLDALATSISANLDRFPLSLSLFLRLK